MSTTTSQHAQVVRAHQQGLIKRIIDRCISLLPYLTLLGYFPGSPQYLVRRQPENPKPASSGKPDAAGSVDRKAPIRWPP